MTPNTRCCIDRESFRCTGDALIRPITLTNVPAEVAAKIRRPAKQRGLSLNGAVISVLAEALDARGSAGGPPYHDLDDLAGSWSAEEAAGFDRALAALRGIDAELGK